MSKAPEHKHRPAKAGQTCPCSTFTFVCAVPHPQKILAAEGKSAVLGSLDENDADADDEGDEVEVDGIADRLANTL